MKNTSHEFQTPIPVAKYMVSLLDKSEINILEPTKGLGNIVSELHKSGKRVTAPDDFYKMPSGLRFDAVVMNPPFSHRHAFGIPESLNGAGRKIGYEILKACLNMSTHVIAIMPWFTLIDSDVRMRFLKGYGLKAIIALPRGTFQYCRIQTIILDLKRGHTGITEFRTFEFEQKKQAKQTKLKI